MATTSDRPKRNAPARLRPGPSEAPRLPQTPLWVGHPSRAPEPNGSHDRLLAYARPFGPGAVLIVGALAAAAVAIALALGGGEAPPATGAAELVPSNALLYVHLSTDTSRPAVRRALSLNRRVPASGLLLAGVTHRVDAILGGTAGPRVDFATDARPWLGKEAALAVLDTAGANAGSLIILDVRNRSAAERFLARVGAQPDGTYQHVSLLSQPSGTVFAFVRHYLVLGQAGSVRSAIDVAARRAPSLAASHRYIRAAGPEPAGRVLDAYGSADGIRRALVPHQGLLGDLGAMLDTPPLSAATIAISATGSGLRLDIHRTLVPRLARLRAYRPVGFAPTLAGVLPRHSILLFDAQGLRSTLPRLLAIAAKAGIAGRIGPLLGRLGSALASQGVNLAQVLAVFRGETALAVTPGRSGSGPAPVIVAKVSHPARAQAILANLEGPLTQVFASPNSGPGQEPEVNDTVVAGVPVHELSLAPGFGLDYAVARGLVVVSTSTAAIAGVFSHADALSDAPAFRTVLADRPSQVTSLVFFDLSQLLRLGEQTGLISSTRQATLWPAVEKIRAVGLASWRGASDTTTELQLQIP